MADLATSRTSGYPTALDTQSAEEKDEGTAGATAARSQPVQACIDAIIKLQTELGVNPSGTYATVVARLDGTGTNDATITTSDHAIGASASDGEDMVSWLAATDLTLEINGTAVRVNASTSAPQRAPIINGKGRVVTDATTATTTLSGIAGIRYIMADVSATALTFALTNDTDNTPTSTEKLVGVAYWDGAAITVLLPINGRPCLYAWQSSAQSWADGASTLVSFANELYDSHAAYNPSTYLYTVPCAGVYRVTALLTATAAPGANSSSLLYLNGNPVAFHYYAHWSGSARGLSSWTIAVKTGDTLGVYIRPNGALTSAPGTSADAVYFCLALEG